MSGTIKRFVIVSDIHGSQADPRATAAALAFTKYYKPEIRVIAGDLWDFPALRAGADDNDRSVSMAEDYEAGRQFAREFYRGGKENHFLHGNHDMPRVERLMGSPDAVKRDLGERMATDIGNTMRECNAKTYPYDARHGVLNIGHLKVVHGFHTGAGAAATHSRIYGNVVYGHAHSIETYQTPGLNQQEARCIGCLCRLDMDYTNHKTGKLRWAHGWAAGWVFPDGTYQINQIRGVNGKFHAATEIKEF
jgi:predicted phosphodiesterase